MQIDSDGEKIRVFYIDAAGDPRHLPFVNSFKQYPSASLVMYQGGIQYDSVSCPIFSIQHLNNLSRTSLNEPDAARPGILSLSPLFLKNTQSTAKLEQYYSEHTEQTIDKKQEKTLKSHIEAYSITVDVTNSLDTKSQNYAIAYKMHKYLMAARNKIAELEARGLDVLQVIEDRNHCYDKYIYTQVVDHDLRLRFIQSIIGTQDMTILKEIYRLSVYNNDPQFLIALIDGGMDLNTTFLFFSEMSTPIHFAICRDHVILLRKLLTAPESQYIDLKDSEGRSFMVSFNSRLSEGFTVEKLEILKVLLEHGANINQKFIGRYDAGMTILFHAVRARDPQLTQKLIEWGAQIDVIDNEGKTPLHHVVHAAASQALIDAGASVYALSHLDETPLHCAIQKEVVEVLLNHHVDIDKKDAQGRTALEINLMRYNECCDLMKSNLNFFALKNTQQKLLETKEIIMTLIERGASPSLMTMHGIKNIQTFFLNTDEPLNMALCGKLLNAMSVMSLSVLIDTKPAMFKDMLVHCNAEKIAAVLAKSYMFLDADAMQYLTHEQQRLIIGINKLVESLGQVASLRDVKALASALICDDHPKIYAHYHILIEKTTTPVEFDLALSTLEPFLLEKIRAVVQVEQARQNSATTIQHWYKKRARGQNVKDETQAEAPDEKDDSTPLKLINPSKR